LMIDWSTMVTRLESRKAKSSRPLDFGVQTISINGNQKRLRVGKNFKTVSPNPNYRFHCVRIYCSIDLNVHIVD
ncbi:Unknown protein, partial [Striga hermonthica]